MTKYLLLFLVLTSTSNLVWSQQQTTDTLRTKRLDEVVIQSNRLTDMQRLPSIQGTHIWSGAKNEVISVQNLDANVAERTPRQLFAKVPGVFVYDMDGSGNQINIATRGLDPHRGWEFNIRKNGIITNSDMYGYPASHFSLPMEAVERIELVRGTGSLQYGAQFGGMLNYVTKKPDSTRALSFETVNTVGSFGLLSAYNAISGKINRFRYYVYYNKRVSNGYRDDGHTDFDALGVYMTYQLSENLNAKIEFFKSNYLYQLPGPMTDSMFNTDPRMSTRSRNYYSPDIYVPSVTLDWRVGTNTKLTFVSSAILGQRGSVMFDKPANIVDAIDPVTLEYANRQVDIDNYHSYTTELRLLHTYRMGSVGGAFVSGMQVFNNDLHRRQQGKGTTGTDYDLTITDDGFGRDLHFKTKNLALFMENKFELARGLSITPGLRYEVGHSDMSGIIKYYDPDDLPNRIDHNFVLLGLKSEYVLRNGYSLYAGWSQAYRPVLFKDIVPSSTYEAVDKGLKDAFGYNLELGYRGSWKLLHWDVSGFHIRYNNRMGTLSETDPDDGSYYVYRTNIGNSITSGLEVFLEMNVPINQKFGATVFTSTAFQKATYQQATARSGTENIDVTGNAVESVPNVISRNGITFRYQEHSLSVLYSYTAESYADALNTTKPSASGATGLVPAYGILDINATVRLSNGLVARLSCSNVTNTHYFTKRPQFYPGPGVWSSDGMGFSVSLALRI